MADERQMLEGQHLLEIPKSATATWKGGWVDGYGPFEREMFAWGKWRLIFSHPYLRRTLASGLPRKGHRLRPQLRRIRLKPYGQGRYSTWEEASHLLQWKIGNGTKVRFWIDDWAFGVVEALLSGEDYGRMEQLLPLCYQQTMLAQERVAANTQPCWIHHLLCRMAVNEEEDWGTQVAHNRSGNEICEMFRVKRPEDNWSEKIWNSRAPATWNWLWFLFLAIEGCLVTMDRLQRFGIHLANHCVLCGKEE
ncbi:hypothetical protein EJ110_NYTH08084 [Nymphaea thermarum]|nr:hypothetical protein EJ110_NYTH08084 [Nymphaea thermarum]